MNELASNADGRDTISQPADSPITGFARLSHFGLIRFSGADAQAFLQGQLSCDVNALLPGQAVYGSYNTPKGRMLASFLLWRDDSGYAMQLPRSLCELVRKRLSMYILRSKVQARDGSDDCVLLGAAGAESELELLFGAIPGVLSMTTRPDAHLLRLDSSRFLLAIGPGQIPAIETALLGTLSTIPEATWDWTNIRAGIPFILPATQEQFVPQMANLDLINGVSFSKGCYPGQEIVARMHYLGKLKQRMYLANIAGDDIPQPGDKLYSADTGEQATGMVLNSAPAPEGGHAVLAVMHISSFLAGDVRLKSKAGARLSFVELPYKIPS